jgi:hypothetical protein
MRWIGTSFVKSHCVTLSNGGNSVRHVNEPMLDLQPGARSYLKPGRRGTGEVRTWPKSISRQPQEGFSVSDKIALFSHSLWPGHPSVRFVHLPTPLQNVKSGSHLVSRARLGMHASISISCFALHQVFPQDLFDLSWGFFPISGRSLNYAHPGTTNHYT